MYAQHLSFVLNDMGTIYVHHSNIQNNFPRSACEDFIATVTFIR
jgi:hypothetical protein